MLYVLTQEEMDELVPKEDLNKARAGLEWMLNVFVQGCVSNPSPAGYPFEYCSECPISDIRDPGKIPIPSREISKAICTRRRRYGK